MIFECKFAMQCLGASTKELKPASQRTTKRADEDSSTREGGGFRAVEEPRGEREERVVFREPSKQDDRTITDDRKHVTYSLLT